MVIGGGSMEVSLMICARPGGITMNSNQHAAPEKDDEYAQSHKHLRGKCGQKRMIEAQIETIGSAEATKPHHPQQEHQPRGQTHWNQIRLPVRLGAAYRLYLRFD